MRKTTKMQNWMAGDILELMEERCNFKHDKLRYAESTKSMRKLFHKVIQ